jgi:hypothetical protein
VFGAEAVLCLFAVEPESKLASASVAIEGSLCNQSSIYRSSSIRRRGSINNVSTTASNIIGRKRSGSYTGAYPSKSTKESPTYGEETDLILNENLNDLIQRSYMEFKPRLILQDLYIFWIKLKRITDDITHKNEPYNKDLLFAFNSLVKLIHKLNSCWLSSSTLDLVTENLSHHINLNELG